MAELADLEARIRHLEDIEAIKRLKHKYLRCLDSKLWDEWAECFTEDATTGYEDGKLAFKGVDAIKQGIKEAAGTRIISHHGHQPEIEITSATTAKGTWVVDIYWFDTEADKAGRRALIIYEEYVKEKGEWKIKYTGFTQLFNETWDRSEIKSLKLRTVKEG